MDPRRVNQVEPGSLSTPDEVLASVLQSQNASSSPGALPSRHLLVGDAAEMKRPSSAVTRNERSPASNGPPAMANAWFAEALRGRWKSYRERLETCWKRPSEEAVHELRVAIRRLLSQFDLLECVTPDRQPQKVRRMLKRQLQLLGPLRDIHVQRVFIEEQLAKFPELSLLRRQLDHRERRLIKSTALQVNHFKTKKPDKWIRAILADLGRDSTGLSKRDRMKALAVRHALEAFAEVVVLRRLIDLSDLRTIHSTRIAFKKFRYIVEFLPSELTGLVKRDLRKLAYYQRKMGNIQDIVVIQASIKDFIKQNKKAEGLMAPFSKYLQRRRGSALRAFLASADQLFSFWPPPGLSSPPSS